MLNTYSSFASPSPSGIRIGTPAVTSRGFSLTDMDCVARFIHAGVQIASRVAANVGTTKIQDFQVFSYTLHYIPFRHFF